MKIWILSQDRSRTYLIDNLYIDSMYDIIPDKKRYEIYTKDYERYSLGTYDTKERAKEVLLEIYNNSETGKYIMPEK